MSREQWCGYQQEVAGWKDKVIPASMNNPKGEFLRSIEEFKELHDAVREDDGTPEARLEIAQESTDVIIRMLGIISTTGHSAAELLETKLGVIKEKYPADVIQGDLRAGVPFDIAMATQKRRWEQRQPNGGMNGRAQGQI